VDIIQFNFELDSNEELPLVRNKDLLFYNDKVQFTTVPSSSFNSWPIIDHWIIEPWLYIKPIDLQAMENILNSWENMCAWHVTRLAKCSMEKYNDLPTY